MVRSKTLLLSIASLLTASAALADLKVSLITASPGPTVFDSLGHSALLVENLNKEGDAYIYEYGSINPTRVVYSGTPLSGFADLFQGKTQVTASKTDAVMPRGENAVRFPMVLKYRYLIRPEANREVIISPLKLTEEQARNLVGLIEKDIKNGAYNFDNYKTNAATKLRDRLFDDTVLGAEARKNLDLDVDESDTSIESLAMESFDEGVESSTSTPKTVSLIPATVAKTSRGKTTISYLMAIGVPNEFKSAKEFQDSIKNAHGTLSAYKSDSQVGPLYDALEKYFFDPELKKAPITRGQSMFLPKRLRLELMMTMNPAVKELVLDFWGEMNRKSSDEKPAPMPAGTAPIPAIPGAKDIKDTTKPQTPGPNHGK